MFSFFAITIVPYLAVSVRRLHDRNVSGWLLLLWLTPILVAMISNVDRFGELHPNLMLMMQRGSFVGPISLLVVFCLKGIARRQSLRRQSSFEQANLERMPLILVHLSALSKLAQECLRDVV